VKREHDKIENIILLLNENTHKNHPHGNMKPPIVIM
jgi:hypothetical protein